VKIINTCIAGGVKRPVDGSQIAMRLSWVRWLNITPRRIGFMLCLLGFIWAMILMNLSISRVDDVTSSDELRVSKCYALNWDLLPPVAILESCMGTDICTLP